MPARRYLRLEAAQLLRPTRYECSGRAEADISPPLFRCREIEGRAAGNLRSDASKASDPFAASGAIGAHTPFLNPSVEPYEAKRLRRVRVPVGRRTSREGVAPPVEDRNLEPEIAEDSFAFVGAHDRYGSSEPAVPCLRASSSGSTSPWTLAH